jgi:tRNA pseudouridine55 synthase
MSSSSTSSATDRACGILNVDKPSGMTSHDVVAWVRRLTDQRKVGHAGTLDPMATGVLLLCLGQATRVAEYLMAGRKQYRAVVRLGASTDTYDADGAITQTVQSFHLTRDQIADALSAFHGVSQQVPPQYSAIRHEGRHLYELARRGIAVETPPRTVEIETIELVAWESPHLTFDVTCSPGTYVRSLAHDLGQVLNVGGYLTALTRLASGTWQLQDAITLDDLQRAVGAGRWTHFLHPLDAGLQGFERVDLPASLARKVSQGQPILLDHSLDASLIRAYAPDDSLVAILQPSQKPGLWRPKKVFRKASDI